ncbi:MAG TPA: diguanylate cyclase, partial [Gemmatimonadales bacterium]|nr:diguanylate cyclase [Gemmatimonadales bacterium]
MSSWERLASKQLRFLHLDRVRNKILAFTVLATLIPSVTTAWISYAHNKRALTEKIGAELQGLSGQAAREVDLWLKEHMYDLKVFTSSYEVSDHLQHRSGTGAATQLPNRLDNYLGSLRERFPEYRSLLAVDLGGHPVGGSPAAAVPNLPRGWLAELKADQYAVGDPHREEASGKILMSIVVPVHPANGPLVGGLAAEIDLTAVRSILQRLAPTEGGRTLLITEDGGLIANSRADSLGAMDGLPTKVARSLFGQPQRTLEYTSRDGEDELGTLAPVPRSGWAVVAELPQREGYAQVIRLRNLTVVIVLGQLLVVGALAYLLGLLIVRPLNRLTRGAAEVASGNFDVDLPVVAGGELGYLTVVFNDMVARLRQGRRELADINETLRQKNTQLERLSVTDPLTGLYNRRHLMETLVAEIRRARRIDRPFSVLMLDLDHFKTYNDAFGHQAGDAALTSVAVVLRECVREVDCAARYGGE